MANSSDKPDMSIELRSAIVQKNVDEVQRLIQRGVDVNKTCKRMTPLVLASTAGNEAIVESLIGAGAEVNLTDAIGDSALGYAAEEGHLDIVMALIRNGASVNKANLSGNTPLINAAVGGHAQVVSVLLQCAAEMYTRNYRGKTAMDRAIAKKQEHIVKLLKQAEDDSRWIWQARQKLNLVKTCTGRVLAAGDFGAGKSSLMRSLASNTCHTTEVDDRTVVMSFKTWKLSEGRTATLYDLGGHETYQHTIHMFLVNHANNVVQLVHKITSEEFHISAKWLKIILQKSTEAQLLFVLSQTDLLSVDEVKIQKHKFIEHIRKEISEEIGENHLAMQYCDENPARKSHLQNVVKSYEKVLGSIENSIYTVSCKQGVKSELPLLRSKLMSLIEQSSVSIPEIYLKFYEAIGKLGVHSTADKFLPHLNNTKIASKGVCQDKNTLSESKPQQNHMQETDDITSQMKDEYQSSASHVGNDIRKLIFLTFDEALEIYVKLWQDMKEHKGMSLNPKDIEKEFKHCLKTLHELGLIIWYGDSEHTSQIIFNDISSFTDMISSLFRHDFSSKMSYDILSMVVRCKYGKRNSQTLFEEDVHNLNNNGIMSENLLYCMLSLFQFESYTSVVTGILENIGIACTISEDQFFLPWYSDNKDIPTNLIDISRWIMTPTKHCQVLFAIFSGRISLTMFNFLRVAVYKRLQQCQRANQMELWSNGIWVLEGSAALMMIYEENKGIAIAIKGNVNNIPSAIWLWKQLLFINEEVERICDEWWPTAVVAKILVCTHCIISKPEARQYCSDILCTGSIDTGMILQRKIPFHTFNLDVQLKSTCDQVINCSHGPTNGSTQRVMFPAALVHPIPDRKQSLEPLHKYLETHGKKEAGMTDWYLCPTEDKILQTCNVINRKDISDPLLQRHCDFLLDNLSPDLDLIDHFIQAGIIDETEYEMIKTERTRKEKVMRVLYCVGQAGDSGLKTLIVALKSTNQGFIAEELARDMLNTLCYGRPNCGNCLHL